MSILYSSTIHPSRKRIRPALHSPSLLARSYHPDHQSPAAAGQGEATYEHHQQGRLQEQQTRLTLAASSSLSSPPIQIRHPIPTFLPAYLLAHSILVFCTVFDFAYTTVTPLHSSSETAFRLGARLHQRHYTTHGPRIAGCFGRACRHKRKDLFGGGGFVDFFSAQSFRLGVSGASLGPDALLLPAKWSAWLAEGIVRIRDTCLE